MSVAAPNRERPHECWTSTYCLEHCEGYRVETSRGFLGFVEEVIWDRNKQEPLMLLVCKSRDTYRLTEVPIAQVREVRPEAEELVAGDEITSDARDE